MSAVQSQPASRSEPAGQMPGERPTLLVFFSATSGSSRRADALLAQVLQRRGNHETFRLLRVDADRRPDLLERFRVTEIPTLILITEQCVRGRLSSPRRSAEISELLSSWLK